MPSKALSPAMDSVSGELWALVEPLRPSRRPAVHGRTGRPRLDDRAALEGIVFVLRTGIGWATLPPEFGYGSGWTCWRRLRQWQDAGAWEAIHKAVLDELARRGAAGLVALLDRLRVHPREKGGQVTGPNPTDRGRRGSKYHLLVERVGTPLNVIILGAHRHDSIVLEPLLDSMLAIKVGGRGHPRRRPVKLHGDKG